jgi:hypothetical protein
MRLGLDVESKVLTFAVTITKTGKEDWIIFVNLLVYEHIEQDSLEKLSLESAMCVTFCKL